MTSKGIRMDGSCGMLATTAARRLCDMGSASLAGSGGCPRLESAERHHIAAGGARRQAHRRARRQRRRRWRRHWQHRGHHHWHHWLAPELHNISRAQRSGGAALHLRVDQHLGLARRQAWGQAGKSAGEETVGGRELESGCTCSDHAGSRRQQQLRPPGCSPCKPVPCPQHASHSAHLAATAGPPRWCPRAFPQ